MSERRQQHRDQKHAQQADADQSGVEPGRHAISHVAEKDRSGGIADHETEQGSAGRGAILTVAYCLGLGVPFVLVALGARWAVGATAVLRRHARTVTRVGGVVLVLVGVLLLTGAWTELMGWLRSWLAATGFGESAL